jgi:tRNA threonylcarbamoyladenosine biosynthesis protein TsaE
MANDKVRRINSTGPLQTETLAQQVSRQLKGREVIELVSDLGGGKTTFVRGLARGLDSTDVVNSPTFKISNVYRSPSLTINHFDLYRLTEPGLVSYELAEVIDDPRAVTIIEWAGAAADVLPAERLTVQFEPVGENDRLVTFRCPETLAYLLTGLDQ